MAKIKTVQLLDGFEWDGETVKSVCSRSPPARPWPSSAGRACSCAS